MRKAIFPWYGRDSILLSAEGSGVSDASEETRQILTDFSTELNSWGLSLENTTRTRLWARNTHSRKVAALERVSILSGEARSASSSYIAPNYFASDAQIAIDLLAIKPTHPNARKVLKEYEPPKIPLRYLIYDSFVFLSGVTAVLPTLIDQVDAIVRLIAGSLDDAGTTWDKAISASFYLHRSERLDGLRKQFRQLVSTDIPKITYVPVDGFSTEGKLIEIEVTARLE
jgi:enamine deaminase RidA (YjgF/YER057c/UK114 family)